MGVKIDFEPKGRTGIAQSTRRAQRSQKQEIRVLKTKNRVFFVALCLE